MKRFSLQNYNEERIPLTSGEVGYQGDSENSESTAPGDDDDDDDTVEDSPLVSHIIDMDKGECLDHISSLHEDVEKLFEAAPKFDINFLSGDSETVISERAKHDQEEAPVVSVLRRPSEPFLPSK